MALKALRINLDQDKEADLKRVLDDYISNSERGLQNFHNVKIPHMRKLYNGEPHEKIKSFPWYKASNLIVPLIGIHTDTLAARILSLIFKTEPLFTFKVFGDILRPGLGTSVKDDLEALFQLACLDEEELDFYNVVSDWIFDYIKLGTGIMKVPHITDYEMVVEPGFGGEKTVSKKLKYDGPRPGRVNITDFLYWPLALDDLRKALFKCHIVRLEKDQLLERAFKGFYDQEKVLKIVNTPDQSSPAQPQQAAEANAGVSTYGMQRFNLYECWFAYPLQTGAYFQIIATYHKNSRTLLRTIHNPYVTGDQINDIFIGARLTRRDEIWLGTGFAEMLEFVQEEASTIHNQRRDNATIANTMVWIAKKNSFMDLSFPIFPGKPIVVDEVDDVRAQPLGSPTTFAFEEEQVALDIGERRSGVSPPMIGYGAGAMGGKRGVYTASGTLSMLQEGNMRTDLNLMDVRTALARVGRVIHKGWFLGGIHDRLLMKFGERAEAIQRAVQLYERSQMYITASSASTNKEVEKQNSMALVEVMGTYYEKVAALFQSITTIREPQMQEFLMSIFVGSRILMRNVLKGFESGDIDRILPQLPGEQTGANTSPVAPGQPTQSSQAVQGGGVVNFPGSVQAPGGPV